MKPKKLTVYVTPNNDEWLREKAASENRTLSAVADRLLEMCRAMDNVKSAVNQ